MTSEGLRNHTIGGFPVINEKVFERTVLFSRFGRGARNWQWSLSSGSMETVPNPDFFSEIGILGRHVASY